MKMTPAQQAAFTEEFIDECGGDSTKVVRSYATADRSRRDVGRSIAEIVKEQWNPPSILSLHWESKLNPTLTNQNQKVERLVVAVGNQNIIKILGIPSYQPSTDTKTRD